MCERVGDTHTREDTGGAKTVPQKRGRSVAVRAVAGSLWKTAVCRIKQRGRNNQLQIKLFTEVEQRHALELYLFCMQ